MAFLPMGISITMYSRRRDIIVLVGKYRRRVVTKQMLFQLQEVLQKSERMPSASSGGMNLARGEAMRSAVDSPHPLARRLRRALRERVHHNWAGSVAGRFGRGELATRPGSSSPGNESARGVRGRRRPLVCRFTSGWVSLTFRLTRRPT
jgi:hypothetical protein